MQLTKQKPRPLAITRLFVALASVSAACVEPTENESTEEPGSPAACEGKCDGPAPATQTCAEQAPPPLVGSQRPGPTHYELQDVPAEVAQLFTEWLALAPTVDPEVRPSFSGYQTKVEKVILSEPDHVIFQATLANYRPLSLYDGFPTLHSFVVFFDGATFRWVRARYEFAVGTSHFVNKGASGAYAGSYNSISHSYTWELRSATGELLDQVDGLKEPRFRRVAEDVVVARNGEYTPVVIRPDAIVWLSDAEEVCAGYRPDPWGRNLYQ